jgi:acyl carrier protein
LKDKIGKKPSAESFKNVRTVGDVVEVIYSLVKEK